MQLKKGSTGKYVEQLQEILGITIDGDFGPKTEKAVKEYQEENDLVVDGIVGSATWTKLNEISYKYNLQNIYDVIQEKNYR